MTRAENIARLENTPNRTARQDALLANDREIEAAHARTDAKDRAWRAQEEAQDVARAAELSAALDAAPDQATARPLADELDALMDRADARIPDAPEATDAEIAAAIQRGIEAGTLIEVTPELLAQMAAEADEDLDGDEDDFGDEYDDLLDDGLGEDELAEALGMGIR
jgi:hypothetical protein